MSSHFSPQIYEPDLLTLMGRALDAAWAKFDPPPKNVELGRQWLASAIIEAVEGGEIELEILTERAFRALESAIHEKEELTSKIAHKIWEDVGEPTDQAKLHWEMAEKEIEDAERAKASPAESPEKLPFLKSEPMI